MREGTRPRRGSVFQVKGFSPEGGFGASPPHRMLRALGVRGVDRKHAGWGSHLHNSPIVRGRGPGVSDRDLSGCCGVQ